MADNKNTFNPDYATHPGEHLEEIILSRGLKKRDIAERLGISVKHLSQIINGHALISPELALALEKVLGISASLWNNLNANYVLFKAKEEENYALEKQMEWVKQFPLKELKKINIIKDIKNIKNTVNEVLNFFRVNSSGVWDEIYNKKALCFRKSSTFKSDDKSVFTWLRLGEIEAEKLTLAEYSEETFKTKLSEIRKLTLIDIADASKIMKKLCAESGVALVFIPELKGNRISGLTEWLSPTKVLLQMSLRYKTNDHFWFTFFHEAGHIILHKKKDIFIDTENPDTSDQEMEANSFARNLLIPQTVFSQFVSEGNFRRESIIHFSENLKIQPGITVGVLQHDGKIPYKWHNDLKEKFKFCD